MRHLRRREIAVRSGLGASPFRLAAQFVTEGLLLVTASAVLGLGAAHWAAILLKRLIPRSMLDGMPFLAGLGLHARELEFAGIVAPLFEAGSRHPILEHAACVVKYQREELPGGSAARVGFVRDRDGWPEDQSRTTGESFGTNQPASSLVNETRRKPAAELDRAFKGRVVKAHVRDSARRSVVAAEADCGKSALLPPACRVAFGRFLRGWIVARRMGGSAGKGKRR